MIGLVWRKLEQIWSIDVSIGKVQDEDRKAYGKSNVENVVDWKKRAPPMPIITT
jgi:hypothetical protein